jgi:tetratricopeptide (TPR) repeat protein
MMKFKLIVLSLASFSALSAQPRFDFLVRNDFFAGFSGDAAALDRGMKACEQILAQSPNHAEAMVWHGGGLFFMSGQFFRKGDPNKGMELYQRGLKEMDDAVALAPTNVGVLIPRGATLLTGSRFMPPGEQASKLLMQGLTDFEKVYDLQSSYFDTLSGHARGELLFGLAEGYLRAGNEAKAREYFEKLVAAGSAVGHYTEAKAWLETGKLDPKQAACTGCHVKP